MNDPLSLEEFWDHLSVWSQTTFGDDHVRGPQGPLKHLMKEIEKEVLPNPTDLEEYADLLFLVFDATRRAGFTYEQLCQAVTFKLAKNRARKWPKPTTDEPVEHIRDGE